MAFISGRRVRPSINNRIFIITGRLRTQAQGGFARQESRQSPPSCPLRPEGSKLAQCAFSRRRFPACSWSFYREVASAALTAAGTVLFAGAFPLHPPAHPPLPGTAPPATAVPDRSSALPAHQTRAQ